jgi:hypothetical protein
MLVPSGNADRDWKLLREEAEAEREPFVEMEATEVRHRYALEPKLERSNTWELPWEPFWETELVWLEVESTELLRVQVKPAEDPRVLDEPTTVRELLVATSCNPNRESAIAVSTNAMRIDACPPKSTSGKGDTMVRCESTSLKLEGDAVTKPVKIGDDIDKGVACSGVRRGYACRGVQTEQKRETREKAGKSYLHKRKPSHMYFSLSENWRDWYPRTFTLHICISANPHKKQDSINVQPNLKVWTVLRQLPSHQTRFG